MQPVLPKIPSDCVVKSDVGAIVGQLLCMTSSQSSEKGRKCLEMLALCVRDGEKTPKIKFAPLSGGGGIGSREENRQKNTVFLGERHHNNILKVQILLSRKFCCHCAGTYCGLSGPIPRDIAILSLQYPISRDTF